MIFVRDKGRLCNNILQYGHLYAWSREHHRTTMSMRFAYKYQYFHVCHTRYHNFFVYLWAKFAAWCGLIPVVSFDEPDKDYSQEEAVLLKKRSAVAQGWYARWYDLFLKYKPEILQLFAFDEPIKAQPDQLLANIPPHDLLLGLHIRRGDYATWHEGRYYFSDQQYADQVRRFARLHPGKHIHVVVCGNDPHLDEDTFRQSLPEQTLTFPKGTPGEDLYLLSQCDYLMGPPSTFTLVAGMYRDLPLYWIEQADEPFTLESFGRFDTLFRNIK